MCVPRAPRLDLRPPERGNRTQTLPGGRCITSNTSTLNLLVPSQVYHCHSGLTFHCFILNMTPIKMPLFRGIMANEIENVEGGKTTWQQLFVDIRPSTCAPSRKHSSNPVELVACVLERQWGFFINLIWRFYHGIWENYFVFILLDSNRYVCFEGPWNINRNRSTAETSVIHSFADDESFPLKERGFPLEKRKWQNGQMAWAVNGTK